MAVISELSPDEWSWINEQLDICRLLLRALTGETTDAPDVEALDSCLTAWTRADPQQRMDVTDFANALGVAFGQLLHQRLDLDWVIATDEVGSDLALYRSANGVLVYPVNSVAKRLTTGEVEFLRPLFDTYVVQIKQLPA